MLEPDEPIKVANLVNAAQAAGATQIEKLPTFGVDNVDSVSMPSSQVRKLSVEEMVRERLRI